MGQVRHGSATTTAAVRRAIQDSQESLKVLARRHGINAKTVAKWRKRTTTGDRKTGPKTPQSTVLSLEEEAMIVAFRRHTLLPLDDCLHASYSRKLVMALIGGLSWRCSRAAILSREKDMPHDEVYHHAVARSIGIFV